MKTVLLFFTSIIAAVSAWFGHPATQVALHPTTQVVSPLSTQRAMQNTSNDETHRITACLSVDSPECPRLSLVDADRQKRAVSIVYDQTDLLAQRGGQAGLAVSSPRYDLVAAFGDTFYLHVIDLASSTITDSIPYESVLNDDGFADRAFFVRDCPQGLIGNKEAGECVSMYVDGSPSSVTLRDSVLLSTQVYDSATSKIGYPKVIATSTDSITLAVFRRAEGGEAAEQVGQRTLLFGGAIATPNPILKSAYDGPGK